MLATLSVYAWFAPEYLENVYAPLMAGLDADQVWVPEALDRFPWTNDGNVELNCTVNLAELWFVGLNDAVTKFFPGTMVRLVLKAP